MTDPFFDLEGDPDLDPLAADEFQEISLPPSVLEEDLAGPDPMFDFRLPEDGHAFEPRLADSVLEPTATGPPAGLEPMPHEPVEGALQAQLRMESQQREEESLSTEIEGSGSTADDMLNNIK